MDADLQEFVKSHLIKKSSLESDCDLVALQERHQKLVDAGYTRIAEKVTNEMNTEIDVKKLPNVLVLKRPDFRYGVIGSKIIAPQIAFGLGFIGLLFFFTELIIGFGMFGIVGGIPAFVGIPACIALCVYGDPLSERVRMGQMAYTYVKLPKSDKLLIECEPKEYLGSIPDSAVQTTIDMKKQDITPKVWAVTTQKDAASQVQGHVQEFRLDPLLVGYHKNNYDYVTVHAIWGKDIEDMDKLFSDRKAEEPAAKKEVSEQVHETISKKSSQQDEINEAIRNKKYLA